MSYLTEYASRIGSEATFTVKPPLTDGAGDSAAGSASSHFGDTFFEKEERTAFYLSELSKMLDDENP